MHTVVFTVIVVSVFVVVRNSNLIPTHLFLKRVGPCYNEPKVAVTLSEFSISRNTYNFTMNGDINISRNIEDEWTVKAFLQKCQDIRNLDTCDHYRSFMLVKTGCTTGDDDDDDHSYLTLFKFVEPVISCPITAGEYKIQGYPYNTRSNHLTGESKISTSMYGYTFRLEGYDVSDEKILCVDATLQLVYLRKNEFVDEDNGEDEDSDTGGGVNKLQGTK